ncbi:MAG TPA: radical SAM protein, partial [Thermodesulfobacteriota bacterium]|nr:radical SAM protein [Thermodesulfobacteriota bacterium]
EVMLKHPDVDWVIRGEGEGPLIELLKAFEKGERVEQISGLGHKQDGRLILNPAGDPLPLETLPFPDFNDFEPRPYLYEKKPLCFLMTSRGCPRRCTFCSVHQTFPGYRRRSVESVLSEMILRYDQGYRVFDFEDDNLTYDQEAFKDLCLGIKRAFPPGSIECLAMNGIAYPSLTPELLANMKEAGFTHLNISLVSYDRKVREKTGRPLGLDRYLAVVGQAFRLGFQIVSYQILGLPEEPLDSMIRTMQFQARLPVLLGPSPYYATPGTLLSRKFPEPTESDLLKSRLTALAIESEDCRREDLYTLFISTRIINFFKGLTLSENQITLPRALKDARNQGKRAALGAELFEKLLAQGTLYGAAPDRFRELPRFNAKLFFALWAGLGYIQTQESKIIQISPGRN